MKAQILMEDGRVLEVPQGTELRVTGIFPPSLLEVSVNAKLNVED